MKKIMLRFVDFLPTANQEDPNFKVFVNILVLSLIALEAIVGVNIFLNYSETLLTMRNLMI